MRKFERELLQSLHEALDHANGEKTGARVHVVEVPDDCAIRSSPAKPKETREALVK